MFERTLTGVGEDDQTQQKKAGNHLGELEVHSCCQCWPALQSRQSISALDKLTVEVIAIAAVE